VHAIAQKQKVLRRRGGDREAGDINPPLPA
jgi:hypothetical protein